MTLSQLSDPSLDSLFTKSDNNGGHSLIITTLMPTKLVMKMNQNKKILIYSVYSLLPLFSDFKKY